MEQAKRTAPAFEAQYLLNLEKWIEEEVNLQLFATKDAYRLNNSATNAPCLPGCKEIKVNNLPEALSCRLVLASEANLSAFVSLASPPQTVRLPSFSRAMTAETSGRPSQNTV
ncbi:MAG: hypothetical protein BWY75_02301 [bacterium ADurb.Bin425]|jgi:hypothetical protein|nr:MAG: hypothetical protein BWY75_02301 [bacterium ADurb.Bin425]